MNLYVCILCIPSNIFSRFSIPVLYYPKSTPLLPPVPEDFLDTPLLDPTHERVKRIAIEPKYRDGACKLTSLDLVPTVDVSLDAVFLARASYLKS